MSEQGSTNNLNDLALKLSNELEALKKLDGHDESINRVMVVKDQLLKEIRAFLEKKNKEVK